MSISSSDKRRCVALIAHDARKEALVDWVGTQLNTFEKTSIYSTKTTGERLLKAYPHLSVKPLKSGPMGGDQQIGAMICEDTIDALIFFVDPLSPMPHDVDVKALTRLATVYDLPMACSPATASLIAGGMRRDEI